MAKKQASEGKSGLSWKGFVQVPVTDEMVERVEASNPEIQSEHVFGFMMVAATRGYKVAIDRPWDDGQYIASLYGTTEDCVNRGFKLTAEAPDMFDALYLLMLKQHEVGWESWEDTNPRTTARKYR